MFDALLSALQAAPAAELVSLAAGVAYAVLAVRRNRWCWAFGAVSSGILVPLSWRAGLPMQSGLQALYVGMAVYGFWHWSRAGRGAAAGLPITRWPARHHAVLLLGITLLAVLLGPRLAALTSAAWPVLDTAATAGSLVATWMVARLQLENWAYWIAVDALSIFLYASQGLAFIALLYAIYLVIAVFGLVTWHRQYRAQQPGPPGS
jgi:nicotinamide mononucleotide transporter